VIPDRRLLRWLRHAATLLFISLAAVAIWVLVLHNTDQMLLPEARAVLNGPPDKHPPAANLYFTALGMGADGGEDLNAEGQRIYALYQKKQGASEDREMLVNVYSATGVNEIGFVGDKKALGCLLLRDEDAHHCIADLPRNREAWTALVRDNRRAVDRYRSLWSSSRYYRPDDPAGVLTTNPLFQHPFVRRLFFMTLALEVDRNELDAALKDIETDIVLWRGVLAQRDLGLIDKMVFLAWVRSDLEFISELLRTRTLSETQIDTLASALQPNERAERSLAGVWDNELRFGHDYSAAQVPKSLSGAWNAEADEDDRINQVLLYLLYRPNARVNTRYRFFQGLSALDDAPCGQVRANYQALRQAFQPSLTDFLGDPLLYEQDSPWNDTMAGYPVRLCDLQGLERIVTLQVQIRRQRIADTGVAAFLAAAGPGLSDPYTGQPMRWNPQNHTLDFDMGDPTSRGTLPWPI